MMWPYQFVDLTDEQKHQRRELLDRYAFIAQISPLLPLLVLQVVHFTSHLDRKWESRKDLEAPSSPYLKGRSFSASQTWRARLRKLSWWMGDEVVVSGESLGTRGQVLSAAAWTLWLLWLSFAQTGNDYLHLTKRFGIVAASQLPLHYLLAIKTPYSPLQLLTRNSHESLNIYHQFLGRIITFLLYLHATFYLNFYIQKNLLASKLQEAYVLCGVAGIVGFTAIGTTALSPVRQWSYRVFYTIHVILATTLLPVLFFHVSHIRVYLYEVAIIHFSNVILRTLNSTTVTANITTLKPGQDILEITIPSSSKTRAFSTAQHAYISLPGHPASRTIRSNPFTLASLPHSSSHKDLKFYARILQGNTTDLAAHASHQPRPQTLSIEGPYGTPTHPYNLLSYPRILFVAGGIGATFIVPLYRHVLADLSPSAGSTRRQGVEFIWVVRSAEDTGWALPREERERVGFVERCRVYVTGNHASSSRDAAAAALRWRDDGGNDQAIEMEEHKTLLPQSSTSQNAGSALSTTSGRPNLRRIVDETFSHSSTERVAVFVCGPKSLSRTVRREVGRKVRGEGRGVWFWEEVYGM